MVRFLVIVVLILASGVSPAEAATFTVSSIADTAGTCPTPSTCTLRQAINSANASVGADTIAFNITGAGCIRRINIGILLPVITESVTLDGTTQANCNTATLGTGGTVGVGPDGIPNTGDEIALSKIPVPEIEIVDNGPDPGVARGLEIRASNTTVRGIAIFGFGTPPAGSDQSNILVERNGVTPSTNIVIEQSVLGLTALGTIPPGVDVNPNFNLFVRDGTGRVSNNLISNNNVSAVQLRDLGAAGSGPSTATVNCNPADPNLTYLVENNEIVFSALKSSISDGVDFNSVHGVCVRGNLIEDTGGVGIDIGGNSIVEENTVRRSGLATNDPYTGDPQNDQWSGMRTSLDDNTIRRNVIVDNYGAGILVQFASTGNTLSRNSIFNNGEITTKSPPSPAPPQQNPTRQIGIDHVESGQSNNHGGFATLTPGYESANDPFPDSDSGGNNLQNFPDLTSADVTSTGITINGTLTSDADQDYVLDFFSNSVADFNGFGEGESFLGAVSVTTNASGFVDFSPVVLPLTGLAGFAISATATSVTDRSTSEFSEVEVATDSTVPVTLASFRADADSSGTRFEWSTATEIGNAGFNLYARTQTGWKKVNRHLIPTRGSNSTEFQEYVHQSALTGDRYVIEDIDARGRATPHGPFAPGQTHGIGKRAKRIDWTAVKSRNRASRERERRRERQQSRRGALTGLSVLVDEDGLYRVSFEALRAVGVALSRVDPGRIGLSRGGESVPIFVQTAGPGPKSGLGRPHLPSEGFIEFHGQAAESLYTKTNVYDLSFNSRRRVAIEVDPRPPARGFAPETFYLETTTAERNRKYSFGTPNGDPWYDTALVTTGQPVTAEFEIEIDDLLAGAAPATARVEMWGVTNWPLEPDHHVLASFNGHLIADERFDGLVDYPLNVELSGGALHEGTNRLELELPGDTGAAWDVVTFDRFSVTYPRSFVARDGALRFRAAGRVFRVDGLPSADVVVYRIHDERVERLGALSIAQDSDGFSVTFSGSKEEALYLVSTVGKLGVPGLERRRLDSGITRGRADYVVITHNDFRQGIMPLVRRRASEGRRVKVVDVADVYARFNHGVVDPAAIRAYIAHAARHMGTEMVLLVGGDTYDYHDYLGLGSVSFIPSPYVLTGPFVSFAPADPAYADIDSDGAPDLAIGRLPVRTREELDAVVAKTLDYSNKTYGRTAVFAADSVDFASAASFAGLSDELVGLLPAGWVVERAYLDETEVAEARQILTGAINQGVSLTSYFGHSGPSAWTFDGLLTTADVGELENHRMPTVVSQFGCWNTYFVSPTVEAMGSKLLSGPQGAAAVLGATTLTRIRSDISLGRLLMPLLARPGMPIGLALRDAKRQLATQHPDMVDVLLGWTLLGDPALVVDNAP